MCSRLVRVSPEHRKFQKSVSVYDKSGKQKIDHHRTLAYAFQKCASVGVIVGVVGSAFASVMSGSRLRVSVNKIKVLG